MKGVIFFSEPEHLSIWGDPIAWTNTIDKMKYDFYIMIDQQRIVPNWTETKSITGHRVDSFSEALDLLKKNYPQCKQVYFTPNGNTDFIEYKEPNNVVYIFGSDSNGLDYNNADYNVKLPAKDLWAVECLSAIWGRFL